MRNPRVLLAAVVAAVAVVAIVALVALPRGDDEPSSRSTSVGVQPPRVVRAKLTLERFKRPEGGAVELLVSTPGPQLNTPNLVRGTPIVWLRCADAAGKQLIRHPYDWPLLEEPGFAPHIHQPASERMLARVRSCSVTGNGVQFEGSVRGRLPASR